jgi:hypothetical protein
VGEGKGVNVMANQRLLVVILLLFLGRPDCTLGERGVFLPESAAAETTEAEPPAPPEMFSTPSVGYIFDPDTRALRPILGTAGAALFGSRVELGMAVRRAWVPPRPSFLLAEVEGSQEVLLLDTQHGSEAAKSLTGLPIGANQVAVSPTGTAMAFYFRADNRFQIVSGLPGSPEVSSGIDVGAPGLLSSLAVSDDGHAALVAFTDAGSSSVYLVQAAQKRVVAQAGEVGAMTFLANSLNAVFADTAANEVRLLTDVTSAATAQILAEESRGISHPLGLQVSADNSRIFVLNSGAQAITTVDLISGLITHVPINGSASKLQRLSGDVFQLTDDFRETTLLFDAASPEPRVVFVPRFVERSNGRSAARDQVPDSRKPLPLR